MICERRILANWEHVGEADNLLMFYCGLLVCLALFFSACAPNLRPVDRNRTFAHAQQLVVTIGTRSYDSANNLRAREYILQCLTNYGLMNPHVQKFSDEQVQDGANVVATAPGTKYPEHIFLLGAHFDSIKEGVGAIDNATGVATLLEIARYFSEHPPAYTLRFVAFDAEEYGVLGSRYYHEQAAASGELDSTRLMLSLDMTQTNESPRKSPFIAFVLSSTPAMKEVYEQVKQEMGSAGSLVLAIPVLVAKQVLEGDLWGDVHYWDDGKRLLAWPWAISDKKIYHAKPGAIDQIDKNGLAISTKFVLEFVRRLQDHTPAELQPMRMTEIPVDEQLLRTLKERGGIKPVP